MMAEQKPGSGIRPLHAIHSGLARLPRLSQANRSKSLPRWAWPVALLAVLALPVIVTALGTGGDPVSAGNPGQSAMAGGWVSSTSLAAGVLFKFGLVIALLYTSLYLLRRWRGEALAGSNRQLAVLETTHLSPRQALHLVRAGDQVLLIGATDQNLTFLAHVEARPEAAGEGTDLPQPLTQGESLAQVSRPVPMPSFGRLLANALLKR
jgi:flagellar biosynthetic protein FliO